MRYTNPQLTYFISAYTYLITFATIITFSLSFNNSLNLNVTRRRTFNGQCQGYVPLTLDVVRVAFKVPLAFHTPL